MTKLIITYFMDDRKFAVNSFKMIVTCDFPRGDHDCLLLGYP